MKQISVDDQNFNFVSLGLLFPYYFSNFELLYCSARNSMLPSDGIFHHVLFNVIKHIEKAVGKCFLCFCGVLTYYLSIGFL